MFEAAESSEVGLFSEQVVPRINNTLAEEGRSNACIVLLAFYYKPTARLHNDYVSGGTLSLSTQLLLELIPNKRQANNKLLMDSNKIVNFRSPLAIVKDIVV